MKQRRKPLRTCIGCRKNLEQDRLVRMVLSPGGEVLIDYRHRLPGRGAYICPRRECLELAVRPGVLNRAFRRAPQRVDAAELATQLREQLRARVDHLVGMARKARQVVVGGNLVGEALARGKDLGCVFLAADISPGIRDKIVRRQGKVPLVEPEWMTKDYLGGLLGRSECSVLGVAESFAEVLLEEYNRYKNLAGDC